MIIDGEQTLYDFGDAVYLKAALEHDEHKQKGLVVWIECHPGDVIKYQVNWADREASTHYPFELTTSKFEQEP